MGFREVCISTDPLGLGGLMPQAASLKERSLGRVRRDRQRSFSKAR